MPERLCHTAGESQYTNAPDDAVPGTTCLTPVDFRWKNSDGTRARSRRGLGISRSERLVSTISALNWQKSGSVAW